MIFGDFCELDQAPWFVYCSGFTSLAVRLVKLHKSTDILFNIRTPQNSLPANNKVMSANNGQLVWSKSTFSLRVKAFCLTTPNDPSVHRN